MLLLNSAIDLHDAVPCAGLNCLNSIHYKVLENGKQLIVLPNDHILLAAANKANITLLYAEHLIC